MDNGKGSREKKCLDVPKKKKKFHNKTELILRVKKCVWVICSVWMTHTSQYKEP